MPVTEKRVHALESNVGQIAQRVANLEGHKEGSSAPQKAPNAILITILSALGVAVIWYWGWVGTQIVRQGQQISQILTILSPEIIKKLASQPDSPQNAKQVTKIIDVARKHGERLDPVLVSEAGIKFVDASARIPEAWKTATTLIDYKSSLNSSPNPKPITPIPPMQIRTDYYFNTVPGGRLGEMYSVGVSNVPNVPELHLIGKPDVNANLPAGPAFVLLRNSDIVLDGTHMKNVIIEDSHIVYRGGPLELENVYFVNCTFDIDQSKGQQFAKAVLSPSPSTDFKAA